MVVVRQYDVLLPALGAESAISAKVVLAVFGSSLGLRLRVSGLLLGPEDVLLDACCLAI